MRGYAGKYSTSRLDTFFPGGNKVYKQEDDLSWVGSLLNPGVNFMLQTITQLISNFKDINGQKTRRHPPTISLKNFHTLVPLLPLNILRVGNMYCVNLIFGLSLLASRVAAGGYEATCDDCYLRDSQGNSVFVNSWTLGFCCHGGSGGKKYSTVYLYKKLGNSWGDWVWFL